MICYFFSIYFAHHFNTASVSTGAVKWWLIFSFYYRGDFDVICRDQNKRLYLWCLSVF